MGPIAYVLHNAQIYTVDDRRPTATALAVKENRFAAVGDSKRLRRAYSDLAQIDAQGATVIPGFIDAHAHLLQTGLSLRRADLNGTQSPAEVVHRLQSFVSEHELAEDAWLRGHGWDQNEWPTSRSPSRMELDLAFPKRPVWLTRTDVHAGWANTAALEATVGVDTLHGMGNPEGGRIRRDEKGRPTGVLVDDAMGLVEDEIPPPTGRTRRRALTAALDHTARHGITSLHDAGTDLDEIQRYRRFIEDDRFPLRAYAMIDGVGDTFRHFSEHGPLHHPSGRLDVASVKLFADGALGSRGAALLEDYSDDPGNRGILLASAEELQQNIHRVVEAGFQPNTHAIGDRANRLVLDAYEAAMTDAAANDRRPRIEHAQVVAPSDRARFGSLDAVACVQPLFATSDMDWAPSRLGPDRIDSAYAWKSLQEAGARLAFSSDAPVESIDPIQGFHAAVTREDEGGNPKARWHANERVSRTTALRAYTEGPAYASFQEDTVGSISPGQRADFAVLSGNIMTAAPRHLLDVETLATYLDGSPIYARSDWVHT